MSTHIPDNWVVIKVKSEKVHYRILAGWSGGYLNGDSWRLNSGITRMDVVGNDYHFYGSSGSCYICGKRNYGLRMNNIYVWAQIQDLNGDGVELMPEDTDWETFDWGDTDE